MCIINMLGCTVLGTATVAQKAWKDRVLDVVVVNPTLVLGSRGTVLVNHLWDQNSVMFLLVVNAPGSSAFLLWVVIVGLLREMLRRQYPCSHVRDEIGTLNHHDMHQATVVFDMPLEGASMSGLCMAFDPPDLAINVFWWLDEVVLVVGDTSRRTIVEH